MNYAYLNARLMPFSTTIPPPPPLAPLSPIKLVDSCSDNWKLPITFQFPLTLLVSQLSHARNSTIPPTTNTSPPTCLTGITSVNWNRRLHPL